MDIFRERVFLRHEEQGSRIIPLVQLKEEVEQLGDVLLTAEYRRAGGGRGRGSRHAVGEPRGDGGTTPAS